MRTVQLALALAVASFPVLAADVKLAVTTSFENSGLAGVLLPAIKADLNLDVRLLVVGTGQALRLGKAGDVDAILVHSRAAEKAFVAEGYGLHRTEIMYNDFILLGPQDDPAGVAAAASAAGALTRIASDQHSFVSRGDDSGTHKRELRLWALAGYDPQRFQGWYREVGAGMGRALNIASALDAYILADRGSWLNFGNKGGLAPLYTDDKALFNQYTFLPVNPARHPHIASDSAIRLERWLMSNRAKALINSYRIGGEQLFVFNGARKGP